MSNAKRKYYSVRTGKNPFSVQWDLPTLRRLFNALYLEFRRKDYFQKALGYTCIDGGEVAGILGHDIEAQVLRRIRKPSLWPIEDYYIEYSEDDLFDIIEFLFDYIS